MNGLCAARNPLWLACLCMLPIYKDQGGLQWHHGEDQGCDASFHEQFECLQAWSLESSDSITYVLVLVSSLLPVVNAVSMRMVKYSCAASVCLPTAERVLISIYIYTYMYIYIDIYPHIISCVLNLMYGDDWSHEGMGYRNINAEDMCAWCHHNSIIFILILTSYHLLSNLVVLGILGYGQ